MGVTGPTVETQWVKLDERWDVPIIRDIDQVVHYKSWLGSVEGPNPEQWNAIQKNWISFLSATSIRPDANLAPNRKRIRVINEDVSDEELDTRRFYHDRRARSSIQVAIYNTFDLLEGLTERWPRKARLILNRACCPTATQPFQTLGAKPYLGKRRRYQSVWTSIVCFLVYCYDSSGALEEMGLYLSEESQDDVLDIMSAFAMGIQNELEGAVLRLCIKMIMDIAPTASNNPLMWWLTVLVRSAIDESQKPDYLSQGRFLMNIIPMDLDLKGRVEAIQHYAKVLILERTSASWEPSAPEWELEVKRDLDLPERTWLNEDTDQRPSDDDDLRSCDSPAWESMLEYLRNQALAYLGGRKDTETILGEVQKLSKSSR